MAKRAYRSIVVLAALALPVTASHSQESPGTPLGDKPFVDHFAPYSQLPEAPAPAGTAVDLGTFDPPVEVEPQTTALGTGSASYYAKRFHGRRTASGERYDMHGLTAAHRTLPFGSMVRVTNPTNGQSVVVRINDRGPFTRGRTIDLSSAAAEQIGIVRRGHSDVELELLK